MVYTVIEEIERNTRVHNKPRIAMLMMCKNEKARIHVTLNSCIGVVDSIITYDTGSTDNTIEIVQDFTKEHNLNSYIIQGTFVDFSESRNVSLDYADTLEHDFLLLMDVNDEMRGGEHLRKFCKNELNTDTTAYLIHQQWWSGEYTDYYNARLLKTNSDWRYNMRIHEYLKNNKTSEIISEKVDEGIILYQDRTLDDDKTGKRFFRDKKFLIEDHKADPTEPRILFYLAQTCACLGEEEESLYYYRKRGELVTGFWEERFVSWYKCGMISRRIGIEWDETLYFFMKSLEVCLRAEPLIRIAEHYRDKKIWHLAYMFTKQACDLEYPENVNLLIDIPLYKYYRWHLLGWFGAIVGEYKISRGGVLKALMERPDSEPDKNNKNISEDAMLGYNLFSKNEFTDVYTKRLIVDNPGITKKRVKRLLNTIWKSKKYV